MATTTIYKVVQFWAGRCTQGGSDKVWAAVLVQAVSSDARDNDEAANWHMLAVYGKTGTNLQGGILSPAKKRARAEADFNTKMKEKSESHHYEPVAFAPFVTSFKVSLLMPTGDSTMVSSSERSVPEERDEITSYYQTSSVSPISEKRLMSLFEDNRYAMSEKANGERCWIVSDGKMLLAYNRRGIRMSAPPEGALALLALGCPCIVDGERLMGELAGHYVIFDLMQWNGQDVRTQPYKTRLHTLQQAMLEAKLLKSPCSTPTHISAIANSTVEKLALLTASTGGIDEMRRLVAWLRETGKEGVIIRLLDGEYSGGRAVQKFKFLSDIDAVVIGFESASSEGSISLGLYRPTDGSIIGIGNVRAGLTDTDIRELKQRHARGEWTVLMVRYLGARTVGIKLVEPQTNLAWVRSDKLPTECTPDQFGDEKAALAEQADPLFLSFANLLSSAHE